VLGRVGLRYLTSSTRVLAGEQRNEGSPDETRRPFTQLRLDAAFDQQFRRMVREDDLGWPKEDLTTVVDKIGAECTNLCDWIDLLCRGFGLRVEISGNAPVIPTGRARAWLTLTDWMDPDVLVCFLLAAEGHHPSRAFYEEWGAITRLFDRDVETVLRRGVSDLHIHLGGVRTANLLWLRVLSRAIEIEHVLYYAPAEVESRAKSGPDSKESIPERDRISALVKEMANPEGVLGRYWHAAAIPEGISSRRPYFDDSMLAVAARERAMLIAAFGRLTKARARRKPSGEHDAQKVRRLLSKGCEATSEETKLDALEDMLDRYIFAKSKFIRRHRQPIDTNPGLGAFQDYFHSTAPGPWGGKLPSDARDEPSIALIQHSFEDLAAYLSQSRHLRRIELRIGPQPSPRDYHRFFEAWAGAERKFGLRPQRIRFAIHLKRSASARSKPTDGAAASTASYRFLCDMDKETATLHRFRTDESWSKHAWRISRIDLAGNERAASPDLASYCMNLIRGDTTALGYLDDGNVDRMAHQYWLKEKLESLEAPRRRVSQLGITCHAGEDFAQPIEGLYAMATAEKLLGMREGDTIGHGLAAGTDAQAFDLHRAPRRWTMRGQQFDAALWLYLKLVQMRSDAQAVHELESWLRAEIAILYKKAAVLVSTPAMLEDIFMERCRPVRTRGHRLTGSVSARLRHMEIWDSECARQREMQVPIAPILGKLAGIVADVQASVMASLVDKGIILEFNPSSNWRISRSPDISAVPFVRIIKMQGDDLRATINTDNPGTFGTRIENEYALVFHALREAGFSRGQALDKIELMRRQGMESVYLPEVGQSQ